MTYPDRRTMETLACLAAGTELTTDDAGRLYVLHTRPGVAWEVADGEIDELHARGWVDLEREAEIHLTDAGRYWLARWLKANRLAI